MANRDNTSFLAFFARLFWILVGPLTLVILAYGIVRIGQGWLTLTDLGYLGVLALMVLARWYDYRTGSGTTAEGGAATPAQLRRYVLGALLLGLAGWVAANVLGNHVLNS